MERVEKITVRPGEILFIPQGWYHRVVSLGEEIVALNFWFDSIFNICDWRENYLLRYLMHEALESKV